MTKRKIKNSRFFLIFLLTSFFAFGSLGLEQEAWAKCDKEFADLQAAERELGNAQQAYDAAMAAHQKASADLNQAVANLNAVAQQLGASGQATGESATFGRSSTNPTFFENPAYKAAKQAWQDAKDALAGAEGDVDMAGQQRMRAQGDYNAAKKAYEDCMRREADLDFLRVPEPLKLDKKLTRQVGELTGTGERVGEDEITEKVRGLVYHRYQDTQKKVTVDAHVLRTQDNLLRVEFISHPPGKVRLKSAQLVSPEGTIYESTDTYDVSEQAARNLGRLRPIPVAKSKKSRSSMDKVSSALLGAGLSTALSGLSSPSHSTAYSAGKYGAEAAKTSSGFPAVGLVSGLAPLAMSGTGSKPQAKGEDVEWVEPKTAGTGIFSSVAEFKLPPPSPSEKPWQLKAEMEGQGGSPVTYTFNFYPVPPSPSIWEETQLTGPSSKLLH